MDFTRLRISILILILGLASSYGLSAQRYALRTNATALLTGNLNIDASMRISDKISLHLPIQYRPYTFPIPAPIGILHWLDGDMSLGGDTFTFGKIEHAENLTIMPGARYWMKGVYNRGIFFGLYGIGKTFKYGGTKLEPTYKDGYALGAGVSVGYSFELSRRWNIEGEIGAGAMYRDYTLRNPNGSSAGTASGVLFTLTRVGVSLVYLL